MVEKAYLTKIMLKVFIPTIGASFAHWLWSIITSWLPDLKYNFFVIDLFGFVPSCIVTIVALWLYLQGSRQERYTKILIILFFVIIVALLTQLFLNDVYVGTGLNFNKPMIFLLIAFAVCNMISSVIGYERCPSKLILISNENSLRETVVTVFSLVGLPLLTIDTYLAFWFFGMGVVGGVGLKDGLNIMLITLTFYSLILYVTNRLANTIGKQESEVSGMLAICCLYSEGSSLIVNVK